MVFESDEIHKDGKHKVGSLKFQGIMGRLLCSAAEIVFYLRDPLIPAAKIAPFSMWDNILPKLV